MRIEVTLPKWPARGKPGVMRLICPERGVIVEARCLGKADNAAAAKAANATRNPLLRMGDLPTGEYIARIEQNPMLPERTYGKFRPLRLIPVAGDALQAKRNGRDGLLQHGGALNASVNLRPTNGCNRVDDSTEDFVIGHMEEAGLKEISYFVKEA